MNTFQNMQHVHASGVPSRTIESTFRGLPDRDALRELVSTYLTQQHGYWPGLVGTDALPPMTDESIGSFAAAFELSYRSATPQPFQHLSVAGEGRTIGAAYARYSDKNSNTRSLDQQLINILRTAAREQVFIPWSLVFADAAISGTTTERNGYRMLQQLLSAKSCPFACIVVDDLDRLNREQIEALSFGKLAETQGKRLITASGHDSSDVTFKLASSFKAIQNDLFIDDLKKKVDRGMTDAFKRGKNLGLPPIGYKTVPSVDGAGMPIVNRKGKCEMMVVIDDDAAAVVRQIFELYSASKLSPSSIAKRLRDEAALGKDTWGTSTVAQILKNERYTGRMTWKTTRTVKNPRTGKHASVPRPEAEHLSYDDPAMRIISDELWQAARRREREVSRDTRATEKTAKSRQSCYPTRLFDLYCRDCDQPLHLFRS
ncbi:MAG: recombinase family protein, partial [Planctomycetaceae bacterium]